MERRNLISLFLLILCGLYSANLVKLVSKCTSAAGVGRCTNLASSCLDVGGMLDDEVMMSDGTKAMDGCAEDEVCCLIPPIPVEESCRTCGKKGTERSLRKSTLERTLPVESRAPTRLRFLRDVRQVLDYSSGASARIMNGADAEKDEWCWQVALLNTDGTVLGSGSLIDGRYVVTAAHKVIGLNSSNLIVLLGQYDFSNPVSLGDNNSTVWYAKPQEVIIHERYDPETMDNNIALLRIPLVSCNTPNICPVCLNDVTDQVDRLSDMTNCFITGWGASNKQKTSPVLQEARVRVLKQEDCRQRFAAVGLADLQLPYSAFCAEGIHPAFNSSHVPVISTCAGDGGGPLVCEFPDGKWRLMGLIAMGLDDCRLIRVAAPTVFVNVGLYRDWIAGVKKDRNTIVNAVSNVTRTDKNRRVPKSEDVLMVQQDEPTPIRIDSSLNAQIKTVFGRSL